MKALITGITGQDGSYLAEHLLSKGYEVWGLIRRSSTGPNLRNLKHIKNKVHLIEGDVTDQTGIENAITDARPDEIYNLAAQSFVPLSWSSPAYTAKVNFNGLAYIMDAARRMPYEVRIYQASTSEMFGNVGKSAKLSEESPMIPRSPYGVSKLAAHRLANVYRESYGLYVSCGILFNHESPRRGKQFVTRKITSAVAEIYAGRRQSIPLGNLDAARDWGYAGDYVRFMPIILSRPEGPTDYVIGTGVAHTVRECVKAAFEAASDLTGIELDRYPMDYVEVDSAFERPAEINHLVADYGKANRDLGWTPDRSFISFEELIRMMVEADLRSEGMID